MAERKTFLLRLDGQVLDAVRKWADDDLRSLNGQIEFLLRRALRERGRFKNPLDTEQDAEQGTGDGPPAPSPSI